MVGRMAWMGRGLVGVWWCGSGRRLVPAFGAVVLFSGLQF